MARQLCEGPHTCHGDAARPRERRPLSDNAAARAGVAQPTIGAKMMGTVIPGFVSSLIALMQQER